MKFKHYGMLLVLVFIKSGFAMELAAASGQYYNLSQIKSLCAKKIAAEQEYEEVLHAIYTLTCMNTSEFKAWDKSYMQLWTQLHEYKKNSCTKAPKGATVIGLQQRSDAHNQECVIS